MLKNIALTAEEGLIKRVTKSPTQKKGVVHRKDTKRELNARKKSAVRGQQPAGSEKSSGQGSAVGSQRSVRRMGSYPANCSANSNH